MKDVLFKYTNCPNFKNTVAMTLSRYIFFLIFTFNFSLFTFHLGAQGVTRYGEYTNASNDYVDKDGKTVSSSALDKTGNTTISSIPTVTSGGGRIWMDRNLGATKVATSITDAAAYGYLYQWGRGTDRHQIIISTTTNTLSSGDAPGNANFIIATGTPYDWRSPQNNNLWQGVDGVNNPCPSGFRIPTRDELSAEMATWSTQTAAGAFGSPLKLPLAGLRYNSTGSFAGAGSSVSYWSSTVGTASYWFSFVLDLSSSSATTSGGKGHAWGLCVRCIKASAPDAPTIGTATAGNALASVAFTPASNGGSAITGYTVTSSPGGLTGTGSASPITVTGLTNGTAYTFTVTATNVDGTGPVSSVSNSVTPATIPGAPTGVTATAGNGQVTVTFTAPVSNGGSAITGYTVTSSPGGFTGTGSGSPITVTGITNLTAYNFTITATNAVGTGTASAQSNSVIQGTVTSSTGKIWMDRNLGATQVATSSTDAASYGDLYQWGRYDDGHQIRTSVTTSTLGNAEDPRTSAFIMASNNDDWSVIQYDNLWQDAGLGRAAGNPCPIGYRLPTSTELDAERASWISNDAAGAFGSPLKLPTAGYRASVNGVIYLDGRGFYWSKTVSGTYSEALYFGVTFVGKASYNRASGMSVRCIKN